MKKHRMSDKTRKEILGLMRPALLQLFPTKAPFRFTDVFQGAIKLALKEAERRLRKAYEPDPKSLEQLRAALKTGVPAEAQNELRRILKEGLRFLPPAPRGAQPKLTEEAKAEVLNLIGKYTADGETLAEAIRRVADKKDVSSKTIKRAWLEKRQEKGEEQ